MKTINTLDKQIKEIMLAAERIHCPKQHKTDWAVAINHQAQLCKYWVIVTKGTRNKIDTTKQSVEILQKLESQ
jgi:hypothetical protein